MSKVSPDIEIDGRLVFQQDNDNKAYLKINHEVPPGKTDEGLEWPSQTPEYYSKSEL